MLIYIALFLFLIIVTVEYELNPFKNDIPLVFIALLLGFFAGLRGPGISKDYESYKILFDNIHEIRETNFGHILPILEPGFTAIVLFFRSLFPYNYVLSIMLFYALTSVALKVIGIKKLSNNPYLTILFYYSQYYLLHEMTQIRIGFASAILFISLIFYIKGNKWAFLLMIVAASYFHYSAFLYLLILFFDSKRFDKIIYSGILLASLVLGYLQIPLLNFLFNFIPADLPGRISNYAVVVESGMAENINVFNILNLLNIGICIYFIIFISKQKLLSDKPLLLFLKCNVLSIFFLSFLSASSFIGIQGKRIIWVNVYFRIRIIGKLPAVW